MSTLDYLRDENYAHYKQIIDHIKTLDRNTIESIKVTHPGFYLALTAMEIQPLEIEFSEDKEQS